MNATEDLRLWIMRLLKVRMIHEFWEASTTADTLALETSRGLELDDKLSASLMQSSYKHVDLSKNINLNTDIVLPKLPAKYSTPVLDWVSLSQS